jgi:hypothetical protein
VTYNGAHDSGVSTLASRDHLRCHLHGVGNPLSSKANEHLKHDPFAQKRMNQVSLNDLTYARFAASVKTRFRVLADASGSIELELAEVRLFQPRLRQNLEGPTLKNECFSLIFNGPPSPHLEQKMYDFQHDDLGTFPLFVVPIGKTREAFQYEVVFNRLA